MLVKTEQLSSHLKKQLPALVWISGDETLLVQETMDNVRQIAKQQGFTEREIHDVSAQFNWNILLESASSLPYLLIKNLLICDCILPNSIMKQKMLCRPLLMIPEKTTCFSSAAAESKNRPFLPNGSKP